MQIWQFCRIKRVSFVLEARRSQFLFYSLSTDAVQSELAFELLQHFTAHAALKCWCCFKLAGVQQEFRCPDCGNFYLSLGSTVFWVSWVVWSVWSAAGFVKSLVFLNFAQAPRGSPARLRCLTWFLMTEDQLSPYLIILKCTHLIPFAVRLSGGPGESWCAFSFIHPLALHLRADANFCRHCGRRLSEETPWPMKFYDIICMHYYVKGRRCKSKRLSLMFAWIVLLLLLEDVSMKLTCLRQAFWELWHTCCCVVV